MHTLIHNNKKPTVIITLLAFLFVTYIPFLQTPLGPKRTYAQSNSCSTPSNKKTMASTAKTKPTPRVGGVALDMAANFLADMSDVTGAYYDQTLDRIVFVGKKNTQAPQFNKDDMAVAIKAVIFRQEIPAVSIDKIPGMPIDHPFRKITYYGGIENTQFGQVLFEADYALKQYSHGRDENGAPLTSSVPTYKSFIQRYIDYGGPQGGNNSRFIIKPQIMTLKKDDAANSFVFDQAKMYLEIQHLNPDNSAAWNQAANDYGNEMTTNYDLYAQETPSWEQAKQLGKIVSVIRWIADSGISTDFNFARDYAPKYVSTPTQIPTFATPIGGTGATLHGEAEYTTANTYNNDTGTSASLKNSAQSVPTTKEDIHWTFTNSGQQYEAVAVTADAFRSLGSFNDSEVDMSFPTAGDLTLSFQRSYSSFSGNQYGVGRGWNIFPAMLYDNNPTVSQFVCSNGNYVKSLAFVSQSGGLESFTINDCNIGYIPDDPAYHSQIFRNADGSYTVRLKDQTEFLFNTSLLRLAEIKDKNGNKISYNYDGSNKLTSITDNKGHQITLNYATFSGQTLISSISDWSGRAVTYNYDDQGNLLTVKDPNNNTTAYAYDSNYKLTSITDKNNQLVLTNTYNEDAKILTQKDAANITQSHQYDKVNRAITITDNQAPARNNITKYDVKGRILEQTDPLSYKISYTYGTEFAPLTIKDKNNNTVTNTYDSNGNLTSITYPDTKKMIFEYDTKNRVTKITDDRYGTPGKITTFTYNAANNLSQMVESGRTTAYTYDTSGEMLTTTDPLNHLTTWTRDTFGNMLTEKDALNKTRSFEYDTIGRLKKKTDADSKIISFTYDANGNLLTSVDAAGTTTNIFDKENRLTKITLPDNTVTEFTYNASGTLTNTKDPALNNSTYGYDAYQNLVTQTDALQKITTNTYDTLNRQTQSSSPMGKLYKYEYDANGNITKRIDANNVATTYLYDAFNRLTKITYPNSTNVTFEYDNRGNRTKMIDQLGTSTYEYDSFDRLTKATNAYGKILQYTYDNANNLKTITYPDSGTVTYTYDNNDRLLTVKDMNNKTTTYTYNNNGSVATRTLPNTVKTTYAYDAANRLKTITHTKSTTTLAKYDYTRDAVGNIITSVESGSFVGTTQTSTYIYDTLGRITKATYPSNKTFEYTYDKMGNRLTQKVNGSTTTAYSYDNDYKLTQKDSLTTYAYDNNGNQTKKPSGNFNPDPTFTFDLENRLTGHVTSAGNVYDYKYDGAGNRLRKQMSTAVTRYIYDTSGPLSRLMATSGDQNFAFKFWIYGIGLLYDTDNRYYLEDGMGNTRFMANSSGSKSSSANYDPFGNIRSSSGILPEFQLDKQQYDEESAMYFLRARYYDPELGRFISRDPVKGTLVSTQSQNPYTYAVNNPINMSDPSGEIPPLLILAAYALSGYLLTTASAPDFNADVIATSQDISNCNWTGVAISATTLVVPVLSATTVKGAANFTKSNLKLGQEMHKAYKADEVLEGVRIKEFNKVKGIRPDFVDLEKQIIYELKPNNPRAIKGGEKQLDKYQSLFQQEFGGQWTTVLDTY